MIIALLNVILHFIGVSMLWFENNFGRIYCNTGQKQPPCPCIKHSLYIVKWHQTSKYIINFLLQVETSLETALNERWERHAQGITFEYWAY